MNPLRSHKTKVALAVVIIGSLLAWFSARVAKQSAPTAMKPTPSGASRPAAGAARGMQAAFDFYLLALTVRAAFCEDGHAREAECRGGAQRPLVIHGLWPEKLEPRTYPHDCPVPALDLDPALELELQIFMPGMADGLHEHEWREHGGCSGLDDDDYFRHALELTRVLDAALGARLTTLAGEATSAVELRATADLFHPGLGATFTLHCRNLGHAPRELRGQSFLIELRQCVDNDGPNGAPGTLLDCAAMNRHDQGCGASFRIAGRR